MYLAGGDDFPWSFSDSICLVPLMMVDMMFIIGEACGQGTEGRKH